MMYRIIICCIALCGFISCLKETKLPVRLNFEYSIVAEKYIDTISVSVDIDNKSTGVEGYSWSFSGALPSTSSQANPGQIIFSSVGIQKITLKGWNLLGDTQILTKEIDILSQMPIPSFLMYNTASDYPPVSLKIVNTTSAYPHHIWYFTGSNMPVINDEDTVFITYNESGTYKATLYLSNGKYNVQHDTIITVLPDIACKFSYTQPIYDVDMEAPYLLQTINQSNSYTQVKWNLGSTQSQSIDTVVRFVNEGDYPLVLSINNDKKQRSCSTVLHLKPNSGIWVLNDVKLAQNTIGVHDNVFYFSAEWNTTIYDPNLVSIDSLKTIDIILYRPNGDMNHLDFLSASNTGLIQVPAIPQATTAIHIVQKAKQHNELQHFTLQDFKNINTQSDLQNLTITVPNDAVKQPLTTEDLPCFVFIELEDNRKAIFYLKKVFFENGKIGVLADIKISKRQRL